MPGRHHRDAALRFGCCADEAKGARSEQHGMHQRRRTWNPEPCTAVSEAVDGLVGARMTHFSREVGMPFQDHGLSGQTLRKSFRTSTFRPGPSQHQCQDQSPEG